MPTRGERIRQSRKDKNDEFYTLYNDIAAELPNYKEQILLVVLVVGIMEI